MCECPPRKQRELPVEPSDFFRLYNQLCACVRLQCRLCGHITLESRYALSQSMVTSQRVMSTDGRRIVAFRHTEETLAWIRYAEQRRQEYARRRKERAQALRKAV